MLRLLRAPGVNLILKLYSVVFIGGGGGGGGERGLKERGTYFKVRLDQVNLLVYELDRPYFKKKQKNNITKMLTNWLFLNTLFAAF